MTQPKVNLMLHLPDLDWQQVLLVKVTREPFTGTRCGVHVSRAHMALHPDGVICAAWDIPLEERVYPRVRLVGWKPLRDVPFTPPVRFERRGDPRVSAIIPNGTWVLPYDHHQYLLLRQTQMLNQQLLTRLETNPTDPKLLWRLFQWTTRTLYKS